MDRFDSNELRRKITPDRVVLATGAFVASLALLLPPWITEAANRDGGGSYSYGVGRAFCLRKRPPGTTSARIHSSQLVTEILGIAFITGALYLVTKPRQPSP